LTFDRGNKNKIKKRGGEREGEKKQTLDEDFLREGGELFSKEVVGGGFLLMRFVDTLCQEKKEERKVERGGDKPR